MKRWLRCYRGIMAGLVRRRLSEAVVISVPAIWTALRGKMPRLDARPIHSLRDCLLALSLFHIQSSVLQHTAAASSVKDTSTNAKHAHSWPAADLVRHQGA